MPIRPFTDDRIIYSDPIDSRKYVAGLGGAAIRSSDFMKGATVFSAMGFKLGLAGEDIHAGGCGSPQSRVVLVRGRIVHHGSGGFCLFSLSLKISHHERIPDWASHRSLYATATFATVDNLLVISGLGLLCCHAKLSDRVNSVKSKGFASTS